MRIYFDVCCLNRPFDDQSQERVRIESEAVRLILDAVRRGELAWVSSTAVEEEVGRNPDAEHQMLVNKLISAAHERLLVDDSVIEKARSFGSFAIRRFRRFACLVGGTWWL